MTNAQDLPKTLYLVILNLVKLILIVNGIRIHILNGHPVKEAFVDAMPSANAMIIKIMIKTMENQTIKKIKERKTRPPQITKKIKIMIKTMENQTIKKIKERKTRLPQITKKIKIMIKTMENL